MSLGGTIEGLFCLLVALFAFTSLGTVVELRQRLLKPFGLGYREVDAARRQAVFVGRFILGPALLALGLVQIGMGVFRQYLGN
jgi:hypothetical protein